MKFCPKNLCQPKHIIEIKLSGNFYLIKNLYSPKEHLVIDGSARRLLESLTQNQVDVGDLSEKEKGILDLFQEHHIILQKDEKIKLSFAESDSLEVWLHTTNNCNLYCKYCYIPKDKASMTDLIAKKSIDRIFDLAKNENKTRVKIKYSGGEPLLVFDKILKMHKYAAQVSKKYNIELDCVMLTNGTLINKNIVDRLKFNQIRLMISLDGTKQYHDAQRVYKNGKGSFNQVMRGIETCMAGNLTPDISITVTNKNVGKIHEIIKILIEKELPFNLNFFRETDCKQAKTKGLDIYNLDTKFVKGLDKAFNVIEEALPPDPMLNCLSNRALLGTFRKYPCGVGQSYLVINHLGQVAKCQLTMGDIITDINDNKILQIIKKTRLSTQNPSVDQKYDCRKCRWKYVCCGGCPIITKNKKGSYNEKSPACGIYKNILPKILKLEGLRLLKYEFKESGKHIDTYDPYPEYHGLAKGWAESYRKGKYLFGEALQKKELESNYLNELFDKFEINFDKIPRIVYSKQDKEKYSLLGMADSWSKRVQTFDGAFCNVMFFYSQNAAKLKEEHEALHLITDQYTQNFKLIRDPLQMGKREFNPLMFPDFSNIRKVEDCIREGVVYLMESAPVKMPRKKISKILDTYPEVTIDELCETTKSKTLLATDDLYRLQRELKQHITAFYLKEFGADLPLHELPNILNSSNLELQAEFFIELFKMPAKKILVDKYLNEEERKQVLRNKYIKD